jgi:hypothetical protein
MGMLSVMDHKVEPRSLQLCAGSEAHVKAPDARFIQEMLEAELAAQVPEQRSEQLVLDQGE